MGRKTPDKPGDNAFAYMLMEPGHAKALVACLFRVATGERLAEGSVEWLSDRLVRADLASRWTDGLFRARMADGGGTVYILLEHKSSPDRRVLLQALEHIAATLEVHGEDFRSGDAPPLRVVHLTLHHGARPWKFVGRSTERVGDGPARKLDMPIGFHYLELDGTGIPGLDRYPLLDVNTRLLGLSGREEVARAELEPLLRTLEPESVDLAQAMRYIGARIGVGEDDLRALVGKYSGEDTEEWMTTFARKWEEVGVRKGMQTGLRKGLRQACREVCREAAPRVAWRH